MNHVRGTTLAWSDPGQGVGAHTAAAEWARTAGMAKERIAGLMASGSPIVVDDTACCRFLRDGYRSLADGHGFRTQVVFVATPVAEVRQRIEANQSTGSRGGLNGKVLEAHLAAFEPPADDEDAIVYAGGDSCEWIEREIPEIEKR